MISFDESQSLIEGTVRPIGETTEIPVADSVGWVLARDVPVSRDEPPFKKANMDGICVRSCDRGKRLPVKGTIGAGQSVADIRLNTGEAYMIMTGAPLPEGAERVIKIEDVEKHDDGSVSFNTSGSNPYYYRRGSDIKKDGILLKQGHRIGLRDLPALSLSGQKRLQVYRKPRVILLQSGGEIVSPGEDILDHQVYDTTSFYIKKLFKNWNIDFENHGIIPDDPALIQKSLENAVIDADCVITTGAVSMGAYDYIPDTIRKMDGFKILFHKVAIRPGRPILTAYNYCGKTQKWIIGLPGNPVSTILDLELFASKILSLMENEKQSVTRVPLPLAEDVVNIDVNRMAFLPCRLSENGIVPIKYHGSNHVLALGKTELFMEIPAGKETIQRGEQVYVRFPQF